MSNNKQVLVVKKGEYGSSKRPVVYLDYNHGGEVPMFDLENGNIPSEVMGHIERAQFWGYEIKFKGWI
jgi:hypothetical protein